MKKGTIILISVIAVAAILIFSAIGSYNGLVGKRESVESAKSAISTDIQARADKIPNLVAVVKDYADYEQETLNAVIEARNSVKNAGSVEEQVDASDKLTSAINVLVEAYPDLKANQQYTSLMDSIEGTENRISTSRKRYNEAAREYNASIKRFPKNIIASIFGFDAYEYFEAAPGTENAPDVGGLLNK